MKKAGWLKNGIATEHGIVDSKGTMLKRGKMTTHAIHAWNGISPVVAPAPVVEEEEVDVEIEDLTKGELEELARTYGVELDKRESKASLLSSVKALIM
jgi:hypothetical protein|tara:strand:- start:1003 stop:1296 length:294 start_codon:yes stop_codon:yes gene_type:complete